MFSNDCLLTQLGKGIETLELVLLVPERGVDVEARHKFCKTVLQHAARLGHDEKS